MLFGPLGSTALPLMINSITVAAQRGMILKCFFNRAITQGLHPSAHKDHLGTHLNRKVAEHVLPVYKRLSDVELLRMCQLGKTENRNERLHNVIWRKCPQNQFASCSKVNVAVVLAVGGIQ